MASSSALDIVLSCFVFFAAIAFVAATALRLYYATARFLAGLQRPDNRPDNVERQIREMYPETPYAASRSEWRRVNRPNGGKGNG